MELNTLLMFILGLALLVAGAEFLVRGASRVAAAAGISPLAIGLTVVAYGTSTPELAVSLQAAWAGQADIAVANVIGSNIFNVLFILGLCALLLPLVVSQQLVWREVPIMIGTSVWLLVVSLDGKISRGEGLLLTLGVVAYTFFAIRQSRKENKAVQEEYAREFGQVSGSSKGGRMAAQIALIVIGLILLVIGARWLVQGAVVIAKALGVSELVIGLTIIAAGTSLPEVATSFIATLRGERDIAIGNVVGSNIYNILAILGLSSLIPSNGLTVSPSMISFDLPVMIAVAVACLPIFFTGHLIARWEGLLFLGYYAAYVVFLILDASKHDALPAFSWVMQIFVLPLTTVTLIVVATRNWRAMRRPAKGEIL